MEIETIMSLFFVVGFIISMWKIYVFLPKTRLNDDDTTQDSIEELTALMLTCIDEAYDSGVTLSHETLFEQIQEHDRFDKEHYWRFNQNRLNHLISRYYACNPGVFSLQDIYESERGQRA